MKNCKITGNLDDIEILMDATVPAEYETLAQKPTATENKVSGVDYTAFMVNKENQSKSLKSFLCQDFFNFNIVNGTISFPESLAEAHLKLFLVTVQCDAQVEITTPTS